MPRAMERSATPRSSGTSTGSQIDVASAVSAIAVRRARVVSRPARDIRRIKASVPAIQNAELRRVTAPPLPSGLVMTALPSGSSSAIG